VVGGAVNFGSQSEGTPSLIAFKIPIFLRGCSPRALLPRHLCRVLSELPGKRTLAEVKQLVDRVKAHGAELVGNYGARWWLGAPVLITLFAPAFMARQKMALATICCPSPFLILLL